MKERVLRTVSQVLGIPLEEVNEQSSPETIEGWDSLKHMNIILALEEEFGLSFTDDEIMAMVSVQLILDTLQQRLS